MMRAFSCFLILLAMTGYLPAQISGKPMTVTGRILDKQSREPVAYATIYNYTAHVGTISNISGYFSIRITSLSDSVAVSFIGYKSQRLVAGQTQPVNIYLEKNIVTLSEVVIRPVDNSRLYNLIVECRKARSAIPYEARAYLFLKNFSNDHQIELVEAFFNADFIGSELEDLHIKTGRFGLRKFNENRFFNSMEITQAMLRFKLFDENMDFPLSPTSMSLKKMKKEFMLELNSTYIDDAGDTVLVVDYHPVDKSGKAFRGTIFVKPERHEILKMTFDCASSRRSPFSPLFPDDSIANLDFSITKEYKAINDRQVFSQTHFSYQLDYYSRLRQIAGGNTAESKYRIKTDAVLNAFDYDSLYLLPFFVFNKNCTRDYLQINALPYNEYFWNHQDDFSVYDYHEQNQKFYSAGDVVTNKAWYNENPFIKKVYESPFITWSSKRILMKDVKGAAPERHVFSPAVNADMYNLDVKIFMDINPYPDTLQLITSTVFDPWGTYYMLPVDSVTNCFLNIYFDICEIERRNFIKSVYERSYGKEAIIAEYALMNRRLEELEVQYLKEVVRGTNRKALEKWNRYVDDRLGINNMELFRVRADNSQVIQVR